MAFKHLSTPPVSQGSDPNGCWAASLSWWLEAVRGYKYSFDDIIFMYEEWTHLEEDSNFGALTEKGLFKLFNDQKWHLMHKNMKNSQLNASKINGFLAKSPVLVGYYEPSVKGFHMNVIVASAGIDGLATALTVMDPAYREFQLRGLSYYKNYYSDIIFAYSMTAPSEPIYGYEE
jgi:hypothetical protein